MGLSKKVKCTLKVGQVKHYPVIERVRYCTGLFPFNRALILLLLPVGGIKIAHI